VEAKADDHHDHGAAKMKMDSADNTEEVVMENGELFTRVLNITVAVV
jgi:hypothetical protein